jgi:hypothetical protein
VSGYNNFTNEIVDWGSNAIVNGGNEGGLWRTLGSDELDYLLNRRNTVSGIRWVKATVNDVCGLIILPDDWESSLFHFEEVNGGEYSSNIISMNDWIEVLEPNGLVFLPAAGWRNQTTILQAYIDGEYWLQDTPAFDNKSASRLSFSNLGLSIGSSYRYTGMAVRLVYSQWASN